MRIRISTIAAFLFSLSLPAFGIRTELYHTVPQINARIFALQDSFPDRVRVDSIGHSQQEGLPIYAVKVSSDVNNDASERPAVIFIGQVHAEEILGVEYVLSLLDKIVHARGGNGSTWRKKVDTYIIPTANPEGLNVVYGTGDYKYRKNKRDNIGDGLFRYSLDWGNDTSGVDVNRNFPFFWVNGDGLLAQGRNEPYDYYRGPAPLSESESVAMDRFNDRIRPVFTVVLHSSRTGLYAEKVIYPWDFAALGSSQLKKSPDIGMIAQTAYNVANRCRTADGGGHYQPSYIATPIGDSDAYFYYRYGSFSYRIEIGQGTAEGIQPVTAGDIQRVIDGVSPGFEYFLNSAAGITSDEFGDILVTRFSFKTTDANTGMPIGANIVIDSLSAPIIPFRTTSPITGVYHWIVRNNYRDTLTVYKFGYATRQRIVNASQDVSKSTIALTPLTVRQVTLKTVTATGIPITERLELAIEHTWSPSYYDISGVPTPIPPVVFPAWHPLDSVWTETVGGGQITLSLPDGGYRMTIMAGSKYVPHKFDLSVQASDTFSVALTPAVALLNQNFDGNDVVFASDNIVNTNVSDSLARWDLSSDVYHSPPRSLTDTERGNTPVLDNSWSAPYDILDTHFDLSKARSAALVYWLNQALEPGYDSLFVEASISGQAGGDPSSWNWEQLAPAHMELAQYYNVPVRAWNAPPINYQRYAPWKRFVIPLDSLCGQSSVQIRFHLVTDSSVAQDGVYLDDVMLLASTEAAPGVTSEPIVPRQFSVGDPYPNPFNDRINIGFALPNSGALHLELYDALGRLVRAEEHPNLSAGGHIVTINAQTLPTGIYLLRAGFGGRAVTRKLVMLK